MTTVIHILAVIGAGTVAYGIYWLWGQFKDGNQTTGTGIPWGP